MFLYRKIILFAFIAFFSFSCKYSNNTDTQIIKSISDSTEKKDTLGRDFPYGIPSDSFDQVAGRIKPNGFLSDILLKHGVSMTDIDQTIRNSKSVFDVRTIRSGNNYILFCDRDTIARARYLVYEHDPDNMLRLQL